MYKTLGILIIGILLLSAALTPVAWWGLSLVFETIPYPYSRVFDRVALLAAVIMIFLLRKRLALKPLLGALKESGPKTRSYFFFLGLIISCLSVHLILPYFLGENILQPKDLSFDVYLAKFFKAIGTATAVSLIEELFFRGLLLENLRTKLHAFWAAILVSIIYAIVHFITPIKTFSPDDYLWSGGFIYLGELFTNIFSLKILPAFIGLFIVGMLLCYAKIKSRSIYLCIGLHFGWVLVMKLVHYYTSINYSLTGFDSSMRQFFLVSQAATWFSFAIAFVFLYLFLDKEELADNSHQPQCSV